MPSKKINFLVRRASNTTKTSYLPFWSWKLLEPWVWATTNYFSFVIPEFCTLLSPALASIKCFCNLERTNVRNIALWRFKPATDSTPSKSFLSNFGQIWLLISPNWTQCAFQSWNNFWGKYLNYSNITLPNPRGKRIFNCPWIFARGWFYSHNLLRFSWSNMGELCKSKFVMVFIVRSWLIRAGCADDTGLDVTGGELKLQHCWILQRLWNLSKIKENHTQTIG